MFFKKILLEKLNIYLLISDWESLIMFRSLQEGLKKYEMAI